jgi:aminoglycoside/choline kinase family phosphotransferase
MMHLLRLKDQGQASARDLRHSLVQHLTKWLERQNLQHPMKVAGSYGRVKHRKIKSRYMKNPVNLPGLSL